MNFPNEVQIIMDRLSKNNYKSYLVGGCVRDTILGLIPKDYDIATNAKPEGIKEIFSEYKVIPTGEEYGTITVVINNSSYEITTFRKDGNYLDGRRPNSVTFGDCIQDDLSRRDLTINSIAYHPQEGYIDPYHGISDIENKIIRCAGNPDDRFNEDALRIMRAIRFACKYDFEIEEKTEQSIYKNLKKIKSLSSERIRTELCQILLNLKYHKKYVYELFYELFEEFRLCKGLTQFNPSHVYDVDQHIMESIIQAPKDIIIRLAMLFHDMGKFYCKEIADNMEYFPQHAIMSYDIAYKSMKKLKFSNNEIGRVSYLVFHHTDKIRFNKISIKNMLNNIDKEFKNENPLDIFLLLMDVRDSDIKAQNKVLYNERKWQNEKLISIANEAVKEPYKMSDLAIDGNDISQLGYKKDRIGKILKKCLNFVICYPKCNNKDDLLDFIDLGCRAVKFFSKKRKKIEEEFGDCAEDMIITINKLYESII